MDCLELAIDPASKLMNCTRPVYGGNAKAVFTSEGIPQIATVRTKAATPNAPDPGKAGEVIPFSVSIDAGKVKAKVLQTVKEEVAGIKLEDASVVVSGGRGMGGRNLLPKSLPNWQKYSRVLLARPDHHVIINGCRIPFRLGLPARSLLLNCILRSESPAQVSICQAVRDRNALLLLTKILKLIYSKRPALA